MSVALRGAVEGPNQLNESVALTSFHVDRDTQATENTSVVETPQYALVQIQPQTQQQRQVRGRRLVLFFACVYLCVCACACAFVR